MAMATGSDKFDLFSITNLILSLSKDEG